MNCVRIIAAGLVVLLPGCWGAEPHSFRHLDGIVADHARTRTARAEHGFAGAALPPATGGFSPASFHVSATGGATFTSRTDGREIALADVVLAADGPLDKNPGPLRQGPLPGLWETIKRDFHALPGDLWDDTKTVYSSTPNLLILGVSYGGSLALQATGPDDTIEDSLRDKTVFKSDVADAFGALGNPATHFGLAGMWYLVGQQRQDEEMYDVGRKLFRALIISDLTVVAGKLATWDKSPNGEYFAFPSGHTSSSFTVAAVMHEAYGPWVGAGLYALSTLVAIERIDSGEHYFSDVIMGAALGLVVGHTVGGGHDLELFGGRIVPYADPYLGATGIAWHKQF